MKVTPYNSRLHIEEIKEVEQKIGQFITVPDFVKERKELPKFMKVRILGVAANLSDKLIGLTGIVETGFYEEVKVDNKLYTFCPISYLVCTLEDE